MTNGVIENPVQGTPEGMEKETCIHYWIIDPPYGPVSDGVCRKCGDVKQFQNYLPRSTWDTEQKDESKSESLLDDW